MEREKNFIEAYYTARKNKRRSADSVEFELHWERNLHRLQKELSDHTFSPSAYTFIAPRPKPREVFACEMALRVVHHYIDIRLRPLIEARLTDRTFNNRVGYGGAEAVNCVISDIYEKSNGFTSDAWIIKTDLRSFFPNANQDIVYRQLSELVEQDYHGDDKDLLHYMILRSVFSYPTKHCFRKTPLAGWNDIPDDKSLFRKPDGIGGAIGHLIWQNAMNYYLNDLDHWLIDECGLRFTRFVDDMVIVTDNKESALALIPEIRRRLKEYGCELHPAKFYCQHYTKGVNFIGTTIKRDRVYVSNRNVRNFRQAVKNFNGCPRADKLESFLATMNSYLGLFKNRNAYGLIRAIVNDVDPRWSAFATFDEARRCFVANPGYTHRERIQNKYHLKFKNRYDKIRTTQRPGAATA